MRRPMTQDFRDQWKRYDLRFCCEDCVHHMDRDGGQCAHAWPQTEHRLEYYEAADCPEVVFCKEFELL